MALGDLSNPYYYLLQVASQDRIPLGFHVDLTYRCDLSCSHCYLESRKRDELTLAEYEAFFAQLADMGCLYLMFSGGDIFVRPDALDIMWAASRHRFDVTLITHAMAVTDEVADELAAMGVRRVAASVYHTDPEIHDRVTRRKGSFDKTIAGLRRLVARGVGVTIKTPVFEENEGAELVMDELADEIGALLQVSSLIRGGNDGTDNLLALNMDLDGKANVYACAYSSARQVEDLITFEPDDPTCLAGRASGYLTPDGGVQPCLDFEVAAGNIRETPFEQIWLEAPLLNAMREVKRSSFEGCTSCENHGFCALCPATAYRETGDMTGSAPSRCRESTAIRYMFERREAQEEAERFNLLERLSQPVAATVAG